MTAAFLQSELASLIQDSKKRQSDVKVAAEKSLTDLKGIQVTSESQLAADLLRRPQFIDPFLLACNSKYVKLAVSGAVCLQRLIASRAVAPTRLSDVLDAFHEATQQGFDVQLKILQALPSMLQLYTAELHGEALAKILSLCTGLSTSKTALVSSTANATFQQLITTLFERRKGNSADHGEIDNPDDVANVFNDMCMVIKGEQPSFLRAQGLTVPLALEVLELSLSNDNLVVLDIASCAEACESALMPGLCQILEKTTNYQAFGRSLRVLFLLMTRELHRLVDILSEPLSIMLHTMDRPSGPAWRRILCLEFMRSTISDFQLLKAIYACYDNADQKKSVVGNLMSILVRVAAEDPGLIGLGRQSTIPTNIDNETIGASGAQVDVDAVGSVLQASSNVMGISSQWSTLESSLLDQLDKQVIPDIPETYIYTLVLGCVASLSDGLSKYIMPFSVPSRPSVESVDSTDSDGGPGTKSSQQRRAEKYQRLMNPLKREELTNLEEIQVCAKMIEDCWPAVLATCSTFLNSALDSYFYHILVRTVQKLAQVSGVMELFTPRDALLTTLAKVSVPINASSMVIALHGSKPAKLSRDSDFVNEDEVSIKSPVSSTPRLSIDFTKQPLNVRNLLCLRALINLGIALGPTLSEPSWFIIIQVLQQADALMSVNPSARNAANKSQSHEDGDLDSQTSLGSEITAVTTASRRMWESTRTYTDETLETLLCSVFKMVEPLISISILNAQGDETNGEQEQRHGGPKHRPSRSVSGVSTTSVVLQVEADFVLKTINDIVRVNLFRFYSQTSQGCTWDLVIGRLLAIVATHDLSAQLRVQAANILDSTSIETARYLEKQIHRGEESDRLQGLCLGTLARQLSLLYQKRHKQLSIATDVEIHRHLLEALENIVSNSGDALSTGWRTVFEILQRTTRQRNADTSSTKDEAQETEFEAILERTIPPAFRTVQLIVSDFLTTIDPHSFSILVQLLPSFGMQKNDLNISLSTTVLFSNLSLLLLERTDSIELELQNTAEVGDGHDPSLHIERKATDVSSLWFAIALQLCVLCKDSRNDVRNSAIRVLVRVFDSASPQMTANSWNVAYKEALIPVLKTYSSMEQQTQPWQASFNQLLEGMTTLFVQNADVIVESDGFEKTWKGLIGVLDTKLAERNLEGHSVVFTALAEIICALPSQTVQRGDFVLSMLRVWSSNHPANIPIADTPNQDSLVAYCRLFTALSEKFGNGFDAIHLDDQSTADLAMSANRQAILASVHSPYSSDVTKLSQEQIAIVESLKAMKHLMPSRKRQYCAFLLEIVDNILTRNLATKIEKQQIGNGAKKLKRPTLIALLSQCITIFRENVQQEERDMEFLSNIPVAEATTTLTKVVATKYVALPTSNDVPAWKPATETLVLLMEALRENDRKTQMEPSIIEMLSLPISEALEATLLTPSLLTKDPPPSAEIIARDEAFDISNLARFHQAVRLTVQHQAFSDEMRKQYLLTLFRGSLVAKPWFGDFPADLYNKPLSSFNDIRPGTVRPAEYYPRTKIPYEALEFLFRFVEKSDTERVNEPASINIANLAARYVLLRTAHSIKVFIADQRLRHLIPPPRRQLAELNIVLNKALHLRVIDEAFTELMPNVSYRDGKSHLRILYPLILRLKTFWSGLPRLDSCAWQDGEDGKAIEKVLASWGEVLAEAWVTDFT